MDTTNKLAEEPIDQRAEDSAALCNFVIALTMPGKNREDLLTRINRLSDATPSADQATQPAEAVAWQVKQLVYKDRAPWVDVDRVTYESAAKFPEKCEVRALGVIDPNQASGVGETPISSVRCAIDKLKLPAKDCPPDSLVVCVSWVDRLLARFGALGEAADRDELLRIAAEQEGRYAEIIGEVSEALGLTEQEQIEANGADKILAAIDNLRHPAPASASEPRKPNLQEISDYLHGLDALQREVVEREARALSNDSADALSRHPQPQAVTEDARDGEGSR